MGDYYWSWTSTNEWSDSNNWYFDSDGMNPAFTIPSTGDNAYWTTGASGTTVSVNTTLDVGFVNLAIDLQSGSAINNGTFGVLVMNSAGNIYGGTFNAGCTNYGTIANGTFNVGTLTNFGAITTCYSGSDWYNAAYAVITDGTFAGSTGYNGGTIYAGTYAASGLQNYGTIEAGTFVGAGFVNYGTINEGTYSGDGFGNAGTIQGGTFTGSEFDNAGSVYGGTFSGDTFRNGSTIFGGTINSDQYYDSFNGNWGIVSGGTFTCRVWNAGGSGTINSSSATPHYNPTGHVAFSDLVVSGACTYSQGDVQADPGFVSVGGTYTPTILVDDIPTGGSDILGAGLL